MSRPDSTFNWEENKKSHTIWIDQRPKSIKEPPMAIELLLVLFLEAKYNLYRTRSECDFAFISNNDIRSIPRSGLDDRAKNNANDVTNSKM